MILTHSGILQVLQFELSSFFFIRRVSNVHCLGMWGLPIPMYASHPDQTETSTSAVFTTYDSTRSAIWIGRYILRHADRRRGADGRCDSSCSRE